MPSVLVKRTPIPLFSIIIPTYNHAKYLPRAIDSVLNQDGDDDFEIVIADDGSTDMTEDVIKGYCTRATVRISYTFQENRGPSAARNHGVTLSKGNYVWFLDADDALLPGALYRVRAVLRDNPSVDFIWGGHVEIRADNTVEQPSSKPLTSDRARNFRLYLQSQIGEGLKRVSVGSLIVHRSIFHRIQYPESTRVAEDRVFNGHVLALFDGVSFSEAIVKKYRHKLSLHTNVEMVRQYRLKMIDLLFDSEILPASLMPLRQECLNLTWHYLGYFFYNSFARVGESTRREYLAALDDVLDQGASPRLSPTRNQAVSDAWLSLFHLLYDAGHHPQARRVYRFAIQISVRSLLRLRDLRKYLKLALGSPRTM